MTDSRRVPDLEVEKLCLGELSPEREGEVLDLLGSESGGGERPEEIRASNDEILSKYPPRVMAAQIEEKAKLQARGGRSRRLVWIAVPSLAAAAVAVALTLVVLPDHPGSPPIKRMEIDEYYGSKGLDEALFVFRRGENGEELLKEGADVKPGDVLQIKYRAKSADYGVIFSVDGRGNVTLHFPSSPGLSTALEHGGAHALGFSFELDDAPRFERFFFVTSSEPLDVEEILETGRRLGPNETNPLKLDEKLRQSDFLLHKDSGR